jgi:transcriptional regulator with XRE-family HTH domain
LKLSDEERRKQLGDRVKAQRQALGLKQKVLAEMIGVVPQVLSVWESGKQEPSPKAIISLSRALKVSTDWILGEEAQ